MNICSYVYILIILAYKDNVNTKNSAKLNAEFLFIIYNLSQYLIVTIV